MTKPVDSDQATTVPTMPTGKEGKQQPAKNAIKHGLYARDVVLPWEDAEEFEALLRAYLEEFNPEGRFEEDLVGQVAQLQWRKHRLSQRHMRGFTTDPIAAELEKIVSQGSQAVDDYVRQGMAATSQELKRNRGVFTGSSMEARELVKRMKDARAIEQGLDAQLSPEGAAEPSQHANARQAADNDLRDRAIERAKRTDPNGSIKPVVDQFVEKTERLRASQVLLDRLYRPQDEATYLKTLGSIDASIQKAIARLAATKEYKMRYGKQTVHTGGAKTT